MAIKKSTTLRLWLWLITAIVLAFLLLSQCSLKKPQLIAHITEDCIKNIPYSPTWQHDLQQHTIKKDTPELAQFYCQCVIAEPMQALSADEIKQLSQLNTTQRMAKLGGAKAIEERNQTCLQQWASQHPSP